jgi:hypothetical protein
VKHLEDLDIEALRVAWRRTYKAPPPAAARKEFLLRILAYAVQEKAHRGLSKSSAKTLREFESAKRLTNSPAATEAELHPGARLVRQWGGRNHEVVVMERGYAYQGASYSSLSEIARRITGARWSGPRFFGLKKKSKIAVAKDCA